MKSLSFCLLVLSVVGCSHGSASRYVHRGDQAPTYRILNGRGSARLFFNESTGVKDAAVDELTLGPGAQVPDHIHEKSVEILYIISGAVEMMIAGERVSAGAGDAIYIPMGAPHSAHVLGDLEPVRAVQVYLPPGPEQRFLQGTPAPMHR